MTGDDEEGASDAPAAADEPRDEPSGGPSTREAVETDDLYAWVMQTTFVVTILVGAPLVAIFSVLFDLTSWAARAEFAVRIGAIVWFVTAIGVFVYAKKYREPTGEAGEAGETGDATETGDTSA
ncbi:DUF5822 domain-containing protein [Haloarchaeobius amylolyticus]|uniref:DUF5822 domain-containing protein n=1 Tax=Haloarchaeobius amylolyticus TaxID=1198296 RepID=UPI0034A1A157